MPPIPARELTSSFALRYQNTQHTSHSAFSAGMMRDVPPWELPEGASYRADDFLCDVPGKLRKRGGYTAFTNAAALVENLTAYRSANIDGITALFGSLSKAGTRVVMFNRSSGVGSAVLTDAANDTIACKPFQHQNLMVCPFQAKGMTTSDRNALRFLGGGTANGSAGITAATVTANDNRVTSISGPTLAANNLGSFIQIDDGGTHIYIGRIVEITSGTACRVEPTPLVGFTANDGQIQASWTPGILSGNIITGKYGVSYQGRVVMANTQLTGGATGTYAKGLNPNPSRVVWSKLQSEAILPVTGAAADGNAALYPGFFEENNPSQDFNYVDVPGISEITGLVVAGEGNLLIFGAHSTFRISGTLATESVANPALTFSLDQVSSNIGCIASKSIQYTRSGVIFAGADNLYLYDGAQMRALLTGHNAKYLQDRLLAGDTILGSAYHPGRNHYYLSMSGADGGLLFNLDQLQMTRLTNMPIFDSAPDPLNAQQLWAVKWWNLGGTAPTITGGQLWQFEQIFSPSSTNSADADGTNVIPVFESKAYLEGDLDSMKRYTRLKVGYDMRSGSSSPTLTVSADTKANVADASYVTVSTGALGVGTTPQIKGFWILPLLKKGQALEVRITPSGACDTFELLELNIGVQNPRPDRSN